MVMWIVFMVGGGWISSLIFYLVSKDKLFVRHHAAETLNLTLVQLPLQILAFALVIPDYISYLSDTFDDSTTAASFGPAFYVGLTLFVVLSLLHYGLCIAGIIHASRARWWRLPLPLHPVRGVVAQGEEPYSVG